MPSLSSVPPPAAPVSGPPDRPGLAAKVQIPWARAGLVERRELVGRMWASAAQVIEVVAPAGYGKTTVLAQWAAGLEVPVAWLSLDRRDDDPAQLLEWLGEALTTIRTIDPAIVPTFTVTATQPIERVGPLLRSMGSAPFVLVIDNLDVITSPAAGQLLSEVIAQLPATARLGVASRSEPPLPTARLRAAGQVLEIRAHHLAMTGAEAAKLLDGAGVAPLSDDQLGALVDHAEGWPVGLYLAALALRGDGVPGGQAVAFRGDDRDVTDYLRSEVLSRLEPDVVTFLLRTSLLDRLSGPLCDVVADRSGSAALLESLERSNLLIIPLDRHREWYRYHRLFREVLAAELRRTAPEIVAVLHERAAEWFETEGRIDEAIHHAQAAGDVRRAARLVVMQGPSAYGTGRIDTARAWLTWFETGDRLARHPEVAALGAIFEALSGEPEVAERWSKTAARDHVEGTLPDGSPVEGLLRAMDAVLCQSGVEQMRLDAGAALDRLGAGFPLRAAARLFSGMGALLCGDPDTADRELMLAVEAGRGFPPLAAVHAALAERAALAIDRHDWDAAEQHIAHALAELSAAGGEGRVSGLVVHAVAARVEAHRGAVADGHAQLLRATRLWPLCTYGVPWTAHHLVQLCHAHLELGDPAGARSVLRQIEDILLVRPALGTVTASVAVLKAQLHTIRTSAPGASSLTTAELRLLPYLATHLSFPEIGDQLYLSRHTIKTQAMSIYRKVGASSRSDAVERLRGLGLLGP